MDFNSPELQSLAERHGFSRGAVLEAWNALHRGGGSIAQFSHPELGGSGQSLPGMVMIGDMFNNGLKSRVENLFNDLRNQPIPPGAPAHREDDWSSNSRGASLSYGTGAAARNWYPDGLGFPSTAGSQNNLRYAYFPDSHKLAIELFGKLTLYEPGEHRISAVSQQQSNDAGNITFTSQFGVIPVSSLRVVDR